MKPLLSNKYLRSILLISAGFFIGWIFFHSPKPAIVSDAKKSAEMHHETWTCSMHPQIRKDSPGKCPICAMDLTLLNQNSTGIVDSDAVHFSKDDARLADVITVIVSHQLPVKEVRLLGKVQVDERLKQNQVAHIGGRIEKLHISFTGQQVKKGELLALIYSPELITAQQELIEAARSKQLQPEIYEAASEKLKQWFLTASQIALIEKTGKVKTNFEVYANTSGIVSAKRINIGDHVSEGQVLFEIVSLSNVWVQFDAYESDLPFLKLGNTISFSMQALPGEKLSGKIKFIDPVIDPVTRVAKVRVEIPNFGGKLKPEMFATGIVRSNPEEYKDKLVIPRSAVLWTGKRSIVYVKQPDSEEYIFKMREIEIGPAIGNGYVVLYGLSEGEEIVSEGTFNVDASAQLNGKPAMMNH